MKFFPLLGLLAFVACANQTPAQQAQDVVDVAGCVTAVQVAIASHGAAVVSAIPACAGLVVDISNGVVSAKAAQ